MEVNWHVMGQAAGGAIMVATVGFGAWVIKQAFRKAVEDVASAENKRRDEDNRRFQESLRADVMRVVGAQGAQIEKLGKAQAKGFMELRIADATQTDYAHGISERLARLDGRQSRQRRPDPTEYR